MPCDSDSAQPQLLYRFIQLFGSHLGMLQCNRCQSGKPVGMSIAPGSETFVLHFDNVASQIAVGLVPPPALMAKHLNVDSQLIQDLQTPGTQHQRSVLVDVSCEVRTLDDL